MTQPGRLSLSWINKDRSLVNTPTGGYEWVDRDDSRVCEIRLLQEEGVVGDVVQDGSTTDNLLIIGDSAQALRSLTMLPEYAKEYCGKVKLAYIDPPFNTGQAFEQYADSLEHSVWLTMMRDRLTLIRDLLAPDGSVWVHLDDAEMAYCKVLMDEVFGRINFVATIVWETDQGRRNDTDVSTVQDYILVYAMNKAAWKTIRNLLPRTEGQTKRYKNPDNDPRGPWLQGADSTARSGTEGLKYKVTLPSGRVVGPPSGVFWRYSQESFQRALDENRVYFGKNGDGMPIVKRYLSEVQDGVVPRTWWPASEVGSNMTAKRDHFRKMFPDIAAFATPKPEGLLERVITIATNPGDIVLDCFAGSGTTAAVAHKMRRRWVTVEMSRTTVNSFTLPRLTMVVKDEDPGGISEETVEEFENELPDGVEPQDIRRAISVLKKFADPDLSKDFDGVDPASIDAAVETLRVMVRSKKRVVRKWSGGGGFRVLSIAPSMYEQLDGRVFLAEWVEGERFAEAARAQLGFTIDPDSPFAARKGRQRLAVVDGVVDDSVIHAVVSRLGEDERATIVAKSVEDGAASLLHELSPGSQLKKAPRDLLAGKERVVR